MSLSSSTLACDRFGFQVSGGQASDPVVIPFFTKVLVAYTNLCNLQCKHCYLSSGPQKQHGLDRERVQELTFECYEILGEVDFIVSGGEPLVRREDTLEILRSASQFHRVTLQTNGVLISPSLARELVSIGSRIQVSIDGSSSHGHDFLRGAKSFMRATEGVNCLIREGMDPSKLTINSTIVPSNVSEIVGILNFAASVGVSKVVVEPLAKVGRAARYWKSANYPDPDTTPIHNAMNKLIDASQASKWTVLADEPHLNCLNVYYDGSTFPFTVESLGSFVEQRGYLGNICESPLEDILELSKFSNAVVNKFLRFATCSHRVLGSYTCVRSQI